MIGSLVAIAVIGTLAWMQNMLTAPIGIGWMYFAMTMALALIVPFGLILFNLIATMTGGAIRMRAPLLFAVGAISTISIGLAAEISHSMVAVAWQLKNTDRRHRGDPLRPGRRRRLRRLRRAPLLVPEDDRAHDGREPGADLLLDDGRSAPLLAFVPLFLAGAYEGQVIDAYKFFDGTGVNGYNLIATIGAFVLADRDRDDARQRDPQPRRRRPRPGTTPGAATRSSGSRSRRRSRTTSTCCPTCAAPAPMRDIREAIAHRTARSRAAGARVAAGSLSRAMSGAADGGIAAQRPAAARPSCATTSR